MTNEDLEKDGERILKTGLEKLGVYVKHIDCNVDGFPDLIVIGDRIVLVEVKFCRSDDLIRSVFQPSQPVFAHMMEKVGYDDLLVCTYNGESFSLCNTFRLLSYSMAGKRMSDLGAWPCLLSSGEAVEFILSFARPDL